MKSAIRLSTANARSSSQIISRLGFVCLQCRQRASENGQWPQQLTPTSYTIQRRAGGNFTDGLRKRIWGTSDPPGQVDPYGDKSLLDRTGERGQQKDAAEASAEEAIERKPKFSMPRNRELGDDYVPATSIADLAILPQVHEVPPFKGFMASSKLKTREEVSAAIHRALVEIYTLHEASMPLVVTSTWEDILPELSGIGFSRDTIGNFTLDFTDENLREKVLKSTSKANIEREEVLLSEGGVLEEIERKTEQANDETCIGIAEPGPEPLQTPNVKVGSNLERPEVSSLDAASKDDSWRSVPLDDPEIKFAVLKRVMQLTGLRIPDPDIDGIKTANGLLGNLVKKPKAKKLAETLKLSNKLQTLPNLQIMDRRYTPIDKEKEVGRWKVIEKELRARGLPVTGHA